MQIKIKLTPDAKLPEYAHPGDSGADLFSAETYNLNSGKWAAISTGISIEVPFGYEIQIRPRSGLALKHGITVLNTPGTVDAGYRGEIKVILINLGASPFFIQKGDKIAQMIIAPVVRGEFEEVDSLIVTQRGEGGFGSTDRVNWEGEAMGSISEEERERIIDKFIAQVDDRV